MHAADMILMTPGYLSMVWYSLFLCMFCFLFYLSIFYPFTISVFIDSNLSWKARVYFSRIHWAPVVLSKKTVFSSLAYLNKFFFSKIKIFHKFPSFPQKQKCVLQGNKSRGFCSTSWMTYIFIISCLFVRKIPSSMKTGVAYSWCFFLFRVVLSCLRPAWNELL